MPRFVFRAWVRDGNRLHRGLLGKSNVYHTNGYVVWVRNDHSEQVLADNPAAEAPRARKFLMRVKGLSLTWKMSPIECFWRALAGPKRGLARSLVSRARRPTLLRLADGPHRQPRSSSYGSCSIAA
jgi:hypothetical protein